MRTPLFIDSFEYATIDIDKKWAVVSEESIISANMGLDDQNALSASARSGEGVYVSVLPAFANTEGICGYVAYLLASRGTITGGVFRELEIHGTSPDGTGTPKIIFKTSDTSGGTEGLISAYDGESGTLYGTSTVPIYVLGEHHFIEVAWKLDNTPSTPVGYVEVRRDGTTILRVTGIDTNGGAWGGVKLLPGPEQKISHLFLMDRRTGNDFVGNWRIRPLHPDANGSTNEWTPSAGTNYECVDESPGPDGDVSYVEAPPQSPGLPIYQYNSEFYSHQPLPDIGAEVHAVQVNWYARKLSEVYGNGIAPMVSVNGQEYGLLIYMVFTFTSTGIAIQLTTAYKDYRAILPSAPGWGTTWTRDNLNATEFGFQYIRYN